MPICGPTPASFTTGLTLRGSVTKLRTNVPTYQYSCTDCGHFFEQFQSFSEDSLTECPACGGKLRKVFNAVGVVFKGSGFYRNDSRGSSSTSEKAGSADSPSKTSASASTGADGGSGSSNGSSSSTNASTNGTPAGTGSKSSTSTAS